MEDISRESDGGWHILSEYATMQFAFSSGYSDTAMLLFNVSFSVFVVIAVGVVVVVVQVLYTSHGYHSSSRDGSYTWILTLLTFALTMKIAIYIYVST